MKASRILLLTVAGMAATAYWLLTPGQAQQGPAALNIIGVVVVPQVFTDSTEIKDLTVEFKKAEDELKREADTRQESIKKLQQALKETFKPGSKEFQDKQQELLHEVINMRVWLEESQASLQNQHRVRTELFYGKVEKAVADAALADGFHLVLYKENYKVEGAKSADELLEMIRQRKILYNAPRTDLTKGVLDRVNAAYKPGPPVKP